MKENNLDGRLDCSWQWLRLGLQLYSCNLKFGKQGAPTQQYGHRVMNASYRVIDSGMIPMVNIYVSFYSVQLRTNF